MWSWGRNGITSQLETTIATAHDQETRGNNILILWSQLQLGSSFHLTFDGKCTCTHLSSNIIINGCHSHYWVQRNNNLLCCIHCGCVVASCLKHNYRPILSADHTSRYPLNTEILHYFVSCNQKSNCSPVTSHKLCDHSSSVIDMNHSCHTLYMTPWSQFPGMRDSRSLGPRC